MTAPVVAVRPASFTAAATSFEEIHDSIASILTLLGGTLSGPSAMAGTDAGGETFASSYDPVVNGPGGVLASIALLSNAAGKMTELLDASAINHVAADTALAMCVVDTPTGVPRAPHTIVEPSVGTAFGGTGEPSNWEKISRFVEGQVFPDGDPDKLDRVADAWARASSSLTDQVPRIRAAISLISSEVSAEVEPAHAQAEILAGAVGDIAGVLDALSTMCGGYADHVRDVRDRTVDEVKELACELVVTAAIGFGLTLLTAGLSDVLATAAGVIKATETGARIAGYIRTFVAAAEQVVRPAMYLLDPVAAVAGDLGALMGSRAAMIAVNSARTAMRAKSLAEALEKLPPWQHLRMELASDPAKLTDKLIEDGMPRELAEQAAAESPYRNMTSEEIYDRYWVPDPSGDLSKGSWKWPPDNGFAGPPTVESSFPEGLQMDRLGSLESGGFLGAAGDSYGERALAPGSDHGYNSFEGTGVPIPDRWELRTGTVAPAFDQPGGGRQWVVIEKATGDEVLIPELRAAGVIRER